MSVRWGKGKNLLKHSGVQNVSCTQNLNLDLPEIIHFTGDVLFWQDNLPQISRNIVFSNSVKSLFTEITW